MHPEKQGYIAAIQGKSSKDTPYAVGSLHWDDWIKGFERGRKDASN